MYTIENRTMKSYAVIISPLQYRPEVSTNVLRRTLFQLKHVQSMFILGILFSNVWSLPAVAFCCIPLQPVWYLPFTSWVQEQTK